MADIETIKAKLLDVNLNKYVIPYVNPASTEEEGIIMLDGTTLETDASGKTVVVGLVALKETVSGLSTTVGVLADTIDGGNASSTDV